MQLIGVLVVPLVLAVVAALLRRWRLALALALLPVLKYAVEYGVVKQTVDRARPFQSVCAEDPSCGQFRDVPLYGPAFVSGHAIIAGAAGRPRPALPRRVGGVAVVSCSPLGVALARVYLGAHNPLDVVGGIAVGVVIGSLLNLAVGVPADATGPTARAEPAWTVSRRGVAAAWSSRWQPCLDPAGSAPSTMDAALEPVWNALRRLADRFPAAEQCQPKMPDAPRSSQSRPCPLGQAG